MFLLAVWLLLSPALGETQGQIIGVWFSPKGGCTEAIVQQIDAAKEEVLVQAYNFTSQLIADALLRAHVRGVSVQAICDRTAAGQRGCVARDLEKAGIGVRIDAAHPIAHNKVIVLDDAVFITGSFNFSDRAERNAENLLILRDADLADRYHRNWQTHWDHSTNLKATQTPKPHLKQEKNNEF